MEIENGENGQLFKQYSIIIEKMDGWTHMDRWTYGLDQTIKSFIYTRRKAVCWDAY